MKLFIHLCLLLLLATPTHAKEVRLSAAASLTNVTRDLISAYQAKAGEVRFLPNFGGSGSLAKQILQGAPADIYISANPRWMAFLLDEGLVEGAEVRILAHNALVVVGDKNLAVDSLKEIARFDRIAIGSPRSVPAGQYTQRALKAARLWDKLRSRLVLAKDVRYALAYADRGEVDAAFVYRTDALLARNVKILMEVPSSLAGQVTYPVALTVEGQSNPVARDFLVFLATDEAKEILQQHGFVVKP